MSRVTLRLLPLALIGVTWACTTSAPTPEPSSSGGVSSPIVSQSWRVVLTRTFPDVGTDPWADDAQRLGDWDGDGRDDLFATIDPAAPRRRRAVVLSQADGRILAEFRVPGVGAESPSGWWAEPVGDLDSDGRADLALIGRQVVGESESVLGIEIRGASRSVPLWTARVEERGPPLLVFLDGVADLDRDGVVDIVLCAAPLHRPHSGALSQAAIHFLEAHPDIRAIGSRSSDAYGWIMALSGKSGRTLWRVSNDTEFVAGSRCVRYPDVDGDGISDLALVMSFSFGGGSTGDLSDRIDIRSGANGQRIGCIDAGEKRVSNITQAFRSFSGDADVDGDGTSDLVVADLSGGDGVSIFSGRSRERIAHVLPVYEAGKTEVFMSPAAVAVTCDLDGDGWRDLLIGYPYAIPGVGIEHGAFQVMSSRSQRLLAAVWGEASDVNLGFDVAWLGDWDHDGRPEFAAVTTGGIKVWSIEGVPASPAKGAGGK